MHLVPSLGATWRAAALLAAIHLAGATAAAAQQVPAAIDKLARDLAAELKAACPRADPASQAAFDTCRQALFGHSRVKASLHSIVLWGRQANNPATPLKESTLTQFATDVFAGLYLPMFMFDGAVEMQWVESEKLYRVKLGAHFRNRLAPGQFPYPFWHEAAKWEAYENANAVLFWIAPERPVIRVAQFTWKDGPPPGVRVERVDHGKFDGNWLWSDAQGRTQPATTLFDGLYSPANPHRAALDTRYRALAIGLREGQCLDCHVPSNPNKLKRLVLLQTPAHAAGEIGRILETVRKDRMPMDETGIENPLPAGIKKTLLDLGSAFEATVNAARDWEVRNGALRERKDAARD